MKHTRQASWVYIKRGTALFLSSLLSIGLFSFLLTSSAQAAASATLNIAPSSGSVTQGSSISVTVQVNAGSNHITGAQACVSYDTSKLTLTKNDTSSSPLTYATPGSSADCTAGQAQIARFDVNPATGTFTLGILTFTSNVANTTTALNFDNAKSYVKDNATTDTNGNYVSILTGSTGSSLTLNAVPAPAPAPAPTSPPATTTPPPTAANPKPTPQPAPSTNTAAITDTSHTTTPTSPVTTPTQAASSDVKVADTTKTEAVVTAKKASSHKVLYIVVGAIVVAVIAGALLLKFLGAPAAGMVSSGTSTAGMVVGGMTPVDPAAPAISKIPEPTLPTPSSVVQPTQPPSSTSNGNQGPDHQ